MELPENNPTYWDDLKVRTLSGIVLASIIVVCTVIGGLIFTALITLAALLIMREWDAMTADQTPLWQLAGYPYVIIPCACFIWLRNIHIPSEPHTGLLLVLALIAIIAATDTGAYFTGKRFGRHRIAPAISPKKTWEGLAGGIAAAIITGLLFSPAIHIAHSFFATTCLCILIAITAQAGDFFQSAVKRMAGVKDSGTLIPGHGGLLDRVDGYMFAAPVFAFLVYLAL